MADAHKTSVAGSLATTLSEKLKVTSAKLGGDHKELNVAIIKATTSQFHVVPKEKHVRTLKLAVHPGQSRRDVTHVITELHRRLQEATDWLTALKTLITLHRLMRESEPAFLEELVRYSAGLAQSHAQAAGSPVALAAPARLFCTDNFIDKTTSDGRFDFSEWVRAYGKYLEEQLTVYSQLRWYVEQEAPGQESRMRGLGPRDLLLQLPHLQRLQRRLLDCMPHGAAMHDPVVLFSLSLVVKESFKLYKAVSECVINLADAFFEMEYHDAVRGLEFYKESMAAGEALSNYYAAVEQIDEIKRTMKLPKLSTPPPDFLASMEAYVAEAPRELPPAGDAPAPAAAKRGVPLRKGKLLQASSGGSRTGSGASVAAAAAALAAAPRDPGMVLPLPSGTAAPAASVSADSGGAGTAPAAASPTSASGRTAQPDLLGEAAVESREAAGEAAAPPKPAPSPLDLLSDLDFSFAQPAGGAAGPAAPGSANPFADVPVEHIAVPAPPAQQQQAVGSSNPFGEPSPAAAGPPASGFGGPSGFDWHAAAPPAAPPQVQQPSWPSQQQAPPQQAYSAYGGGHGGGYGSAYGAPLHSPAGATVPHTAVPSDDPFASFGAPSPAAPRPAAGGFWAAPSPGAVSGAYGAVPVPPRATGDELSKAALHDPFASLTGLPPKSSPGGSTGAKPSPPRTTGAYPAAGFF